MVIFINKAFIRKSNTSSDLHVIGVTLIIKKTIASKKTMFWINFIDGIIIYILQANPDYKGVCHVALAQEGHCRPGEVSSVVKANVKIWNLQISEMFWSLHIWQQVLFGTDSHTTSAGAFGQFATGVGNTDAAFILGTGKILLKASKKVSSFCYIWKILGLSCWRGWKPFH